jgi:hypothetical protein
LPTSTRSEKRASLRVVPDRRSVSAEATIVIAISDEHGKGRLIRNWRIAVGDGAGVRRMDV